MKMQKIVGKCCFVIAFLSIFIIQVTEVMANENVPAFVVRAQASPFQVDRQQTYFDLQIPEKQKIALSFEVENLKDTPITLSVSVNQATTNMNGVVEYAQSSQSFSRHLPFKLKDCVTIAQPILTIAAKATVMTTLFVQIPSDQFSGVVAGGITFLDITKQSVNTQQTFNNRFAYTIALLIHGVLKQQPIHLTFDQVQVSKVNNQEALMIPINNQTANFVNQVVIKASVYNKKKHCILRQVKDRAQIAPNSQYKLPIFLNEQSLDAGKYQVKLEIQSNQLQWQKIQTVTLKQPIASIKSSPTFLPSATKQVSQSIWLLVSFLIVCVLILIGVIVYLLGKNNQIRQ